MARLSTRPAGATARSPARAVACLTLGDSA